MKIVHLCLSNFYIDNYSYQENMLPKYHQKMGLDVSIIASLVSFDNHGKPCLLDGAKTYYANDGYKVVRLNYKGGALGKLNSFIRIYENLMPTLKAEKPDVLFIHDYSFMDIIPVMKYAKENNIKVFVDCHTDYINSASSWVSKHIFHHIIWRKIGKWMVNDVEMFYGVTPLRCDFLKDAYHLPDNKVELLRMGIDDDYFKERKQLNVGESLRKELSIENEFVILTGGKIDYLKNIHLVLEAFRNISSKYPDATLVVFGNIDPEVKVEMERLLDFPKIKFVGWLSSNQIMDYFIMADLIIFPGTHSVLWEQAIGTGTPAVFKYWKGIDHVDVGGNSRFLYKDSVEEITLTLDDILKDDKKVYNEMLHKATTIGREEFSYSNIAKESIKSIGI